MSNKQQQQDDSNGNWWIWLIIILIIVAAVLIYIAAQISKGTNIKSRLVPDELKENRKRALLRHKKLKGLIQKQEKLMTKLKRRFWWTYFATRIVLIGLWFSYLGLFMYWDYIRNISDAVTYSEVALLIIFALYFLCFGTIHNINNFFDFLKIRLENWVWGKYIKLPQKVEGNQQEMKRIEDSL